MKHRVYAVTAAMMTFFLLFTTVGCAMQPTVQATLGTSESAANGSTEWTTDNTIDSTTAVTTSGVSQTTRSSITTTKSVVTVSCASTTGRTDSTKSSSTTTGKTSSVSTSMSNAATTKPTTETTTKTTVTPATWRDMPPNTNENLRYFGYVHSDGFGVQESYMADIAALGNANMAVINSAWTANEAAENLKEAKKYGFRAIVTVHGIFRYKTFGELDSAVLIDDWQAYWNAYQATVQSYIDDGTIYAFYFDEPRWFGISCEDFLDVTLYIRQKSRIRMMACMTAMDMGWSDYGNVGPCEDKYLRYCTDVLFDDYSAWDDEQRRRYLEALKAKAPASARIWGCPRAMETQAELDAYGVQRLLDHIKGQYREAVGEERYVGIIAFSFANGIDEGDWGYGLRDFFDPTHPCYSEELRGVYLDVGKAIIG